MSAWEDLRSIALAEFARAGYGATSLQRVAELAGVSKSSVLYHFASKEALLEAGVAPAIADLELILDRIEASAFTLESRTGFIADFVDLVLERRLEVNIFINQGPSLVDVPVVEQANQLVARLAAFFDAETTSVLDKMRFGIALGGAAYCLTAPSARGVDEVPETEETRAALITILTELLAPIPVRSTQE